MTTKFFNKNAIDSYSNFIFTSALTTLASFVYDNNFDTKLVSLSSNDATPEIWEFIFNGTKKIDLIQLVGHNIKSGKIEYWNGSAYVDFNPAISLTNNTDTDSVFEATQVSTTKIKITMNTAMITNAQKYIAEIRALELIGSTSSHPSSVKAGLYYKKNLLETSSGGVRRINFGKKFSANIIYSDITVADENLFITLLERQDYTYIYLCSGIDTSLLGQYGFSKKDIYPIVFKSDFFPEIKSDILGIGSVISIEVAEI